MAGDVNGDGKPDLILMNGLVEIFLGNGDGTFSTGNVYHPSSLGLALGVAAADFNSDGKLDIAAAGCIMLGNGNGTLQGWPAVDLSAYAFAIGKFNQSGAPEIAALSGSGVSILDNDGSGTLSLAHTYTLQQPGSSIAVADINGDGNLDLVIGDDPDSENWSYSVLLGNGDGSFRAPVFYQQSVTGDGSMIVIADFNGDGKPDLAFPAGSGTVAVLLGNGNGTFGAASYDYDGGASWIVSADFNGDGKADIVGALPLSGGTYGGIGILLGNGDGTFQPAAFPITQGGPGLLTADLNGDNNADLIVGGSSVYLGNGKGAFTQTSTQAMSSLMAADYFADINGDGVPDAIGNLQNGGTDVSVALGNGDGTFGPYIVVVPSLLPMSAVSIVQAADMNGGGKQDLVVLDQIFGSIFTVINTTASVAGTNFSPASAIFPSQTVGSSSSATAITLSNSGAVALKVTGVSISGANAGEFTQANNCATVQPLASCTINVTFTPTAAGAATANLVVADNAGSGSQMIAVAGTGTAAPSFTIGVPSGGSSSSTVSAGQTATFNLALTPTGSFTGTVNFTCAVAPKVSPAPVCNVPASVSVSGSSAASVMVTISTTAPGSASGGLGPHLPLSVGLMAFSLSLGASILLLAGRRRRVVTGGLGVALACVLMVGCGGGGPSTSTSGSTGTPAGTCTATVTATSGSLSQQMPLTVVVQ